MASAVDPPRTPAVGPAHRSVPVQPRKRRRGDAKDAELPGNGDEGDKGTDTARRKGRHIDEHC